MQTVVVTPPAAALLDVPTIRARLGLATGIGDDASLAAYIAAATAVLDGPDGWLGRALGEQTLEMQGDHFPEFFRHYGFADTYGGHGSGDHRGYQTIHLHCPPIASVTSVTYVDPTGAPQTLDPTLYQLSGRELTPAYSTSWPSTRIQQQAVKVRYVAGYPSGQVPAPIIQAIVLAAAKFQSLGRPNVALKQDTVIGVGSKQFETMADFGAVYDKAAAALLAPYRVIDR